MLLTSKNPVIKISNQGDDFPIDINETSIQNTVADSIVKMLEELGVHHAFGIGGGAIAAVWEALEQSSIEVLHFRHEAGAAFAAMEAYFANNCPVVVFTTTGPGLINALTGIAAAKSEGAKLILVSACTPTKLRGKWAFQETSADTMPEEVFTTGSLFHYAHCIESGNELSEIAQQLADGLNKQGGFVAHLSIPTDVQTSQGSSITIEQTKQPPLISDDKIVNQVAHILSSEPFAIWLGFGARHAAQEIFQLASKTGAAVMCSPRGKGIFPENHPQFLGVTGFAGHQSVLDYMHLNPPKRILVLGTRLGEFTSFWNSRMIPSNGIIHVDIDPDVPGAAYPEVEVFPVVADIKTFLSLLLEKLPLELSASPVISLPSPQNSVNQNNSGTLVRPRALMDTIQSIIVEGSDAIVLADAGNCLAWAIHYLKFNQARRWRGSTGFGSMGYATTGVLGATLASGSKAVVLVGDGAMLMNNEINTAVQYGIPAVWIVLNDASYNMCHQGMHKLGYKTAKTPIAPTNFVMLARSMGADGVSVESESQLLSALSQAMSAKLPFVVDVKIDPTQAAPITTRITNLIAQTAS